VARVFVAMSGGVDSSVAAALLVSEGHDVTGVTMRLLAGEDEADGCCSLDGARSAKRVCDVLGIPHYTLEFAEFFEREVIEPYCDEYAAGRTPNPCIVCNDRVKFSELLRRVALQDAELLATGHYARIQRDGDGRPWLARGADAAKDQSYFLYRLTPAQMDRVTFPLADLTKTRVRSLAREFGLPSAERAESQETCFVPGDDVRAFVRSRRASAFERGPIVDESGAIVGTHDGAQGFTVGQRRGLGIGGTERLFVTGVDVPRRTVHVGRREALSATSVIAGDVVWRGEPGPVAVTARTRYRGLEAPSIARVEGRRLVLEFGSAVEAPAPGQSVVCYDGGRVVGGGVIEEAS
jgi:tRNA-specific 2-thiouridylase